MRRRDALTPDEYPPPPRSDDELEERLSRPGEGVTDAIRAAPGDVVVLGAGGKMGLSLTRMIRRAADTLGDGRTVFAVSRWTNDSQRSALESVGVRVLRADLEDPAAHGTLPDAPNVVYMAGQKFGTSDAPHRAWMSNVVLPALATSRYRDARIVAFSTGNVYPFVPVRGRGSVETDTLAPVGEYAMSCLGRERVLEHASHEHGTRVAFVRLNYAVDLRYGVLVDVAEKVRDGLPVNVTTGFANVIWQGDANSQAVRCLPRATAPPFVLNVTGPDRVSIRDVAMKFGEIFGAPVTIEGHEAPDALLSDTTRARAIFGEPSVSTSTLIEWVADWVQRGGSRLGKPTHFEERGGRF